MQLTANTCHFAKSRHSLHCSLNVKNEYILGHCVRFSRSCCRTPRRNRVHGNYSMHAPLRLSIARNPSIERETENVPCTVIVLQAMHAAALKIVPEIFCFRRQALHIIVYSETVFVFEGGFRGGGEGAERREVPMLLSKMQKFGAVLRAEIDPLLSACLSFPKRKQKIKRRGKVMTRQPCSRGMQLHFRQSLSYDV